MFSTAECIKVIFQLSAIGLLAIVLAHSFEQDKAEQFCESDERFQRIEQAILCIEDGQFRVLFERSEAVFDGEFKRITNIAGVHAIWANRYCDLYITYKGDEIARYNQPKDPIELTLPNGTTYYYDFRKVVNISNLQAVDGKIIESQTDYVLVGTVHNDQFAKLC